MPKQKQPQNLSEKLINSSLPGKQNPTPRLGKPDSRRQTFTHSENKLLDQMTLEITEAWKKDLLTMRTAYRKVLDVLASQKNITTLMEEKLPALNEFLSTNSIVVSIPEILDDLKIEIQKMKGEIVHDVIQQINRESFSNHATVEKLKRSIYEVFEEIVEIKKQLKKSWWKKIFKNEN